MKFTQKLVLVPVERYNYLTSTALNNENQQNDSLDAEQDSSFTVAHSDTPTNGLKKPNDHMNVIATQIQSSLPKLPISTSMTAMTTSSQGNTSQQVQEEKQPQRHGKNSDDEGEGEGYTTGAFIRYLRQCEKYGDSDDDDDESPGQSSRPLLQQYSQRQQVTKSKPSQTTASSPKKLRKSTWLML